MRSNDENELTKILKLIAPGTPIREGLDNILKAKTGALLLITDKQEVIEEVVDGGFFINEDYTSSKLYELAKMDGAIVLSGDMKKILFSDIDGTLLDYENKLPASADRAIKEARKNGHRVYICTGRSEVEVYDYIWDIGIDGVIGGNGSYVKDEDTVVMHQLITL